MIVKISEDEIILIAEEEKEKTLLGELWSNALMIVSSYSESEIKLKGCKVTECLHSIVDDLNTKELVNMIEVCLKEIFKRVEEIEMMFKKAKILRK